MEALKKFGGKKLGGLILIIVIVIAFGFGGFGGGFSTNNQNNIAKINKTNVTTQDFMDYVNQSGISQEVIRNNLDNNVIEELLSGLISTTLINLEIKDFDITINSQTILKIIKENKNFQDEDGVFQRLKYEKFLLSNNQSAPMFELKLKNRELQKHLFNFIGAGTITPDFLIEKKFTENNKSLNIKFFEMEKLYKAKKDYSDQEIKAFIEKNKKELKREFIDFKYVILNPKNLVGIDEFNQEFFDEIDKIENLISGGNSFNRILEGKDIEVVEVNEYAPNSESQTNDSLIYQSKTSKLDLIENGDNFLLYNITNIYEKIPDLNDDKIKNQLVEIIYQNGKYDYNKKIFEQIQKKEFDNSAFIELGGNNIQNIKLSSVNDDTKFDINSIKVLYSLPVSSFTLINDKDEKIYLVKIISSKYNSFNKSDDAYIRFEKNESAENRKNILQSYDQLLNNKYQVKLNQKTIDRVKNYFK